MKDLSKQILLMHCNELAADLAKARAQRDHWQSIAEEGSWPFEWQIATRLKVERDEAKAEVERLRKVLREVALPPYADSDTESLLTVLRTRAQSTLDLQACGHPRSAIVTADDLGGPGTGYCGMCFTEALARQEEEQYG